MGQRARGGDDVWAPAQPGGEGDRPGTPDGGPDVRGATLAGLAALVGMVLGGVLVGLLWAAAAPRLDVGAVLAGSESAFDAQAGVDAYFGLISVVAGVVGGLVALWRGRDAGWRVPLGLLVGGLGGSLLAGTIGHALRHGGATATLPPGASSFLVSLVDFEVRADGLYLVLPGTALLVLTLGLWLTTRFGTAD